MPLIQMTAISSRNLANEPAKIVKQTRDRAKKGLRKWAAIFREEYNHTTASWKQRPIFTVRYKSTPEGEEATISTGSDVYRFLHDGTKVRWAVMSNPFSPKTHHRILSSSPGSGGPILRGRKAMAAHGIQTPMPGIKAREWTQEILRLFETRFQTDMDKTVFGDFPSS